MCLYVRVRMCVISIWVFLGVFYIFHFNMIHAEEVDWKKVHSELRDMQKDLRDRLRREKLDEYKRTKALIVPILADKNNYHVDGTNIVCNLDCRGALPINKDMAKKVVLDLGFIVQNTHLNNFVVRIKEDPLPEDEK